MVKRAHIADHKVLERYLNADTVYDREIRTYGVSAKEADSSIFKKEKKNGKHIKPNTL